MSFDTIVKYLLLGVWSKYLHCFLLSRVPSSLQKATTNIQNRLSTSLFILPAETVIESWVSCAQHYRQW